MFPSSQIFLLDSIAKIQKNTHLRENQRADDLSREDSVLRKKCLQCQMLRKAEKEWKSRLGEGQGSMGLTIRKSLETIKIAISSSMVGQKLGVALN